MVEKKKGGPIERKRKKDILEEIKKIIESGRMIGYTESQLAKNFEINRRTVKRYLEEIYSNLSSSDINKIKVNLDLLFSRIFREGQDLINKAHTNKEKKEALEFMLKTTREFIDYLEKFGIKEKIPEKAQVESKSVEEFSSIYDKVLERKRYLGYLESDFSEEEDLDEED